MGLKFNSKCKSTSIKVLTTILAAGYAWLVFGMAIIPDTWIYQSGLIFGLYLPVICLLVIAADVFKGSLSAIPKPLLIVLICYLLYMVINLLTVGVGKDIKYVLFLLLVMCGVPYLHLFVRRNIKLSGAGLTALLVLTSAYCMAMIFYYYGYMKVPLTSDRLYGLWKLAHPNIASNYLGVLTIASLLLFRQYKIIVYIPVFVVFLITIALMQSRGAYVAVILTSILWMLLFSRNKNTQLGMMIIGCLIMAIVYYLFGESVLARGDSYRIAILEHAWDIAQDNLWLGKGIGKTYIFYVGDLLVGDAHNVVMHVLVLSGLIGLAGFIGVYALSFYYLYKMRSKALAEYGAICLVFCFLAFQFDGAFYVDNPKINWLIVWGPIIFSLYAFMAVQKNSGETDVCK